MNPKKKIIILGGGATGWTVACLLRKQLPKQLVDVQLLDIEQNDTDAAEAARASIANFHDLIGLTEKAFVLESGAIFGLGTCYKNWSYSSQNYVLGESVYGAPLADTDFHQLFTKATSVNSGLQFDAYSLNAVAAKLGKFAHPIADPTSIYSTIGYGLHLELHQYSKLLKRHGVDIGVEVASGRFSAAEMDQCSGNITTIYMDAERKFSADFFIDCTGRDALLVGSTLDIPDVPHKLSQMYDRIAFGNMLTPSYMPLATLEHGKHGFIKRIPLQGKESLVYAFSTREASSLDIEVQMLGYGVGGAEIAKIGWGRKENFWVKNCLAIGRSSFDFCETYLSHLNLVRNSVVRFLDVLVDLDDYETSRCEYNRLSVAEFDELAALSELQFYVAQGRSHALANYFAEQGMSAQAQHRLDLFRVNGRHVTNEARLIAEREYTAFFLGNGLVPKTWDLTLESLSASDINVFLENIKEITYKAASRMPNLRDYLAHIQAAN